MLFNFNKTISLKFLVNIEEINNINHLTYFPKITEYEIYLLWMRLLYNS